MTLRTPVIDIAAGSFVQGDDHHYPEERPARIMTVDAFSIDRHPVTNRQFAAFVAATGHVGAAESTGGNVFVMPDAPVDLGNPSLWWRHDPMASWRRTNGRDELTDHQFDHPVVQVGHADAVAYASWAGGRLPTETEWEWAASGGIDQVPTWPLADDGMLLANVWIGEFPSRSTRRTRPGTTPVGAYPPNVNELFDMLGNVWEWTEDTWTGGVAAPHSPCCTPATATTMVTKGGSYLCAANYCSRYRPAARHPQAAAEPSCHIGFRCAYDSGTQVADG